MLDARQIHSMSDFLRNHKAHVARLKETGTPEVLTINGRAEVVMLDTASYEDLMDRLQRSEAVASIRTILRTANSMAPLDHATAEEIEQSKDIVRELQAETERLGLY
ncbi:hypothetical protein CCAX7_23940 [Capsulimonas corticalis]|uniref:Uncharacterized protein n=1 Tax=Capsulimonas corticalis TaxID=2219043 RepID=A0A402CVB8_9BACT|nr:type II toxin-antitoxin system Phd/YefM family antitoxin [Capsulimonas corticalis]BDI30343.1 hypothetical protein CCAX7_23940 [Capsulimonas corticalis]